MKRHGVEEIGRIGHSLAGHCVIGDLDVERVYDEGHGSSLLYGELLPAGVALLAEVLFSDEHCCPQASPDQRGEMELQGPILELGMGTGKVALQLFLSLRRDVYGVELAPSRFELAAAAFSKLASTFPGRFRY